MVENYHYLCSVLSLLTASKDTKKRRDLQILDKRNMEGNLFDKVSNDKLDMLHEALSEVISDMRYAGESVDATFTDEAFWACWKSHTNLTHAGKVF